MKDYLPLFLLLSLSLLAACGQSRKILPVQETLKPSATLASKTATPTALLVSPSPSPSLTAAATLLATSTKVQEKSATATPTATSTTIPPTPISGPLSQNGPWMMLSQETLYHGPVPIIAPVFSNLDGSAWEPANLPREPFLSPDEADWWFGNIAPKGPYVAFQNYLSEYSPECKRDETTRFSLSIKENTLYILKLPENKVVRKFRLLGPLAWEELKKEECSFFEEKRNDTPPVLGVIQNIYSLHWSPDGRFLAFPAAPDGRVADLYLYDTETDTSRRLTTRQNNPDVLGWSPDGKTIIYRSVNKMDLQNIQILESSGLYAVSTSGSDRFLLKPSLVPEKIYWLSDDKFIVEDAFCNYSIETQCSTHLRLVDLTNNTNEVLYSNEDGGVGMGIFYVSDPKNHLFLVVDPPVSVIKLGMLPEPKQKLEEGQSTLEGIYQFDLQTRTLRAIYEGETGYPAQDEKQSTFRFYRVDEDPPYPVHVLLISYVPGEGFHIEKQDNPPDLSPDGSLMVTRNQLNNFIQDANGNPVQPVQKNDQSYCGWSPDSSSYVQFIWKAELSEIWFTAYLKESNWRPTLVRRLKENYNSCQWITP